MLPINYIMLGGTHHSDRPFVAALAALTVLFLFRVVAQLATYWQPLPLLPPFDAWHSNVVPYPLLVLSQAILLWLMLRSAVRIHTGRTIPSPAAGRWLVFAGALYATIMLARLALGLTLLADIGWFNHWLPTLFHLVLASFLLVLGKFHRSGTHASR